MSIPFPVLKCQMPMSICAFCVICITTGSTTNCVEHMSNCGSPPVDTCGACKRVLCASHQEMCHCKTAVYYHVDKPSKEQVKEERKKESCCEQKTVQLPRILCRTDYEFLYPCPDDIPLFLIDVFGISLRADQSAADQSKNDDGLRGTPASRGCLKMPPRS